MGWPSRASAADGGLGVALGAAVAIESRPQTAAFFSGRGSGNGVYFGEDHLGLCEVSLLDRAEAGEKAAGIRRAAAWSRVFGRVGATPATATTLTTTATTTAWTATATAAEIVAGAHGLSISAGAANHSSCV